MHCHSTASHLSRLGVQRSLGLPEWELALAQLRDGYQQVLAASTRAAHHSAQRAA
jgi:hypothetical protein